MTVDRIHESSDEEIQAVLATELPPFIELPEFKAVYTMSAHEVDGAMKVRFEQDPHIWYDDPNEAYDALEQENADIEFDDSISRPEWGELSHGMYFTRDNRLLLSHTDQDRLFLLKNAMYTFLEWDQQYAKTPEDLVAAYEWLRHHPAFWYRQPKDSEGPTLDWITDDGFHSVWIDVHRDQDGATVIGLEHGNAVPPARVMHFHDPRLDTYEPTFEQAYLKLAQQVAKFFNTDGTEKSGGSGS